MFSDDYFLTQAVLNRTKTVVRQKLIIPTTFEGKGVYGFNVLTNSKGTQCVDLLDKEGNVIGNWKPKYKVDETVAIAQPYKDIVNSMAEYRDIMFGNSGKLLNGYKQGWNNKMFVESTLMLHHIKITDVKVELLQNISDYDIMREGVYQLYDNNKLFFISKANYKDAMLAFISTRDAFTYLIDKIMGNGTWKINPWVVAYSFKLVD